jgi:hypothetical protein
MTATQYAYGTKTSIQIVAHWCNGCGLPYGLPEGFIEQRREDHKSWTCPNGCVRHFAPGKSDKQKLADAEHRELALKDQLAAAIRDAETTRAALLRDRARFAAGVCPCCNRSFENVRRHMQAKHPDYDVARIDKHAPIFKCSCGRQFESYRGLRAHQGHQRSTSGTYAWDAPDQSRYYAHLTEVKV